MLKLHDWIDIKKINWYLFSQNSNIFTYDYIKMKETMKESGKN